ncbi:MULTISPECIES: type VI secretion system ImpA family N-terminal domain-containing protein [Escherichia]|uniref:ImpA domain protein n=1 Tax=Escherichia albertii (strain TW07627) TaxID=502347 RepID=A0ABC9NVI6_ESCAT|nr:MULTISPECIES: type VI secretion system ImpA family N-terminal domain-containing protein [Escherichia]EFW7056302.1 type VI secretion protein ImpA [Shigella sonnei]EDS94227.1 ImpA domain protein [Escherichia albertii TW07627]EER3406805.1 type VI secretion protein ImpA [Escherichia coli]EEW0450692.1 type VI secretion protein ImpA [Escherichia coli]EEW3056763.1 type VI secretion protein ImpA [Escherichia coli]
MTSEVKLKTGGDPRSLPDYAALRDEISKLTHPARPDVDWRYVETLCLRLYEHNGVELQTASALMKLLPGRSRRSVQGAMRRLQKMNAQKSVRQ